MCLLNSLIVQSTTVVAVTWSAAVHVIGQTPVLRLPETKQNKSGCLFLDCVYLIDIPS